MIIFIDPIVPDVQVKLLNCFFFQKSATLYLQVLVPFFPIYIQFCDSGLPDEKIDAKSSRQPSHR